MECFDSDLVNERRKMSGRRHVLGIDVGTTTVRGLVYSEKGEVEGEAKSTIQPLIPRPGCYEIDPDTLSDQVNINAYNDLSKMPFYLNTDLARVSIGHVT